MVDGERVARPCCRPVQESVREVVDWIGRCRRSPAPGYCGECVGHFAFDIRSGGGVLRSGQCAISPHGHGPVTAVVPNHCGPSDFHMVPRFGGCGWSQAFADTQRGTDVPAVENRHGAGRCRYLRKGSDPGRWPGLYSLIRAQTERTSRPGHDQGGSEEFQIADLSNGLPRGKTGRTGYAGPASGLMTIFRLPWGSIAPECQRTRRSDKHHFKALCTGHRAVRAWGPSNSLPILQLAGSFLKRK